MAKEAVNKIIECERECKEMIDAAKAEKTARFDEEKKALQEKLLQKSTSLAREREAFGEKLEKENEELLNRMLKKAETDGKVIEEKAENFRDSEKVIFDILKKS